MKMVRIRCTIAVILLFHLFLLRFTTAYIAHNAKVCSSILTPCISQASRLFATSISDNIGRNMYEMASKGNIIKLQQLIDDSHGDKNILNYASPERYGRTPLVIASYYGMYINNIININIHCFVT